MVGCQISKNQALGVAHAALIAEAGTQKGRRVAHSLQAWDDSTPDVYYLSTGIGNQSPKLPTVPIWICTP
jgi:hypothetical protein